MQYEQFVISHYRAIEGPLTIDVSKPALTPIVGVNESGKTTVLHAIFAFDYLNDASNEGGRHLRDTSNLYTTTPKPATVTATVKLERSDIEEAAAEVSAKNPAFAAHAEDVKRRRGLPEVLDITRDLKSLKYMTSESRLGLPTFQHALCEELILRLPYILFFDDFRDKIEEKIEIVAANSENPSEWLLTLDQLFSTTEKGLSVYSVPQMEARQRKTVLAKVKSHLNRTLTRQWQSFRLDGREALEIEIEYLVEAVTGGEPRHYLKLEVVESDSVGEKHYFYISDRSKGFYWFFNFVMKLEFNHKYAGSKGPTIYLLDEPGSYLHAFAQRKLCAKLRQLGTQNRVIFCTHSHYLLDPETIPVSSVRIAEKDDGGGITLTPLSTYSSGSAERRTALQPVLDALQLRPFALDVINTRCTIITEGIYDYIALELFKDGRPISILPSVNADSVKFYISLLVAWQIDFRALWDHDAEGQARLEEAKRAFGEDIASRHFHLLPLSGKTKRRILQDLFDGSDLAFIRSALGLARNTSFERTLQAFFYSPERGAIRGRLGARTIQNFQNLYASMGFPISS